MLFYSFCDSPIGKLVICSEDGSIVSIGFSVPTGAICRPSPLTDLAARQLSAYLKGARKSFEFPIRFSGTDFQRAVWSELMRIPYGQTRTYGEIAAAIGTPNAARAVGMACSKNPLWIVIPCHRVLGQNRNLTGYAVGLTVKRYLLELEQENA